MYGSFSIFSVSDERELRDPERLRTLAWKRHTAWELAAIGLLALGGLACLALAAYGGYVKFTDLSPTGSVAGWSMLGVGLFFGAMMLWMAYAFGKEIRLCPLRGCLKYPQQYDFTKGSITDAVYLPGEKSSRGKMLVKGEFGAGGLFFELFDADVWSDAVAERGEEGLKPGDDRYDQKGKRVRMPIEVWVVYRTGTRGPGAIAGIPAETAARLARGEKGR